MASAIVLVAAAGLIAAPSASAATTIGSNLAGSPTTDLVCNQTCTVSPLVLPATSQATGGLLAPNDGVVVRWRVKVGIVTSPAALRVTRPGNADTRTGAGTGPTVTPPTNQTSTYNVQLPIQAGDALGLDCCADFTPPLDEDAYFFAPNMDAVTLTWVLPRLEDGAPPRSTTEFPPDAELLVNADIEPDADCDGLGDETQDANITTCPVPPEPPTSFVPPTCKGLPATIVGTERNDVRTGSQGQDVIAGLGGKDTLKGLGDNDVICGGSGRDTLKGGKGKDTLLGQKGKDTLKGGPSKDLCKGGKGDDTASKCEVEKSI
jgi:hypothetical protein